MHVFVGSAAQRFGLTSSLHKFNSDPILALRCRPPQFIVKSQRRQRRRDTLPLIWAAAGGTMASANVFNPGGEAQAVESLPFNSRRSAVLGTRGMVACSQPLAAEVSMQQFCIFGRHVLARP